MRTTLLPLVIAATIGCFFPQKNQAQSTVALPEIQFNQHLVESLSQPFPTDSVEAMFRLVFRQLPDSVFVWPTENYYYFRTFAGGQWWWGNLRFCVLDRDQGHMNFAYYAYVDDPKSPDEGAFFSKSFSADDGLLLKKVRHLAYSVQYEDKTVLFQLNDLPQTPPAQYALLSGEVFVNRTFDESGLPFFLMYHETEKRFFFVLDEEGHLAQPYAPLNEDLVFDPLRGFVFYMDKTCAKRRILVGVWAQNVRRNNYWDGPFDQLADNAPHPRFKEFLEAAYPYAQGGLDEFGFFKLVTGSRMAVTPYFEYESIEQLLSNFNTCQNTIPAAEFFACLCYDYKSSFSANGE